MSRFISHAWNRMLARGAFALAFASVCLGCGSFHRTMDHAVVNQLSIDATSFNLAIEQTQNEMLLLNVVRSMKHAPLYITDTSKVTGTVKADVNLGLKIPLVHLYKANDAVASPFIDFQTAPSMDVNLLNSKDFTTGFLAPISPERFAYYWSQGWPSEMLLYLFVLKAEQMVPDPARPAGSEKMRVLRTWINHPNVHDESLKEIRDFSDFVDDLVRTGRPVMDPVAEEKAIGPALRCDELSEKYLDSLRAIAGDDRMELTRLESKPGHCQLTRRTVSYVLHPPDEPAEPSERHLMATDSAGKAFRLTLRSPEGILYFLGQIARMENGQTHRKILMVHPCDMDSACSRARLEPLFVMAEGESAPCPTLVKVRGLDGTEYSIPDEKERPGRSGAARETEHLQPVEDVRSICDPGRSMQALALLSQLIGLQKTATDFSTTSTVRVIGQ